MKFWELHNVIKKVRKVSEFSFSTDDKYIHFRMRKNKLEICRPNYEIRLDQKEINSKLNGFSGCD